MPIPPFMDYFTPLQTFITRPSPMSPLKRPSLLGVPQCTVQNMDVTTLMHRAMYKKMPLGCDQKLFVSKHSNIAVLLRESSESEDNEKIITILLSKFGRRIELTKSAIKVNGQHMSRSQKEIKSADGKTIAEIKYAGSMKTEIVVPGLLTVELSKDGQTVVVKPLTDQQMVGAYMGLCGHSRTTSVYDEMVDEDKCQYRSEQGSIFTAAMTHHKQECRSKSSADVQGVFREYEEFKKTCPKSLREQARRRRRQY